MPPHDLDVLPAPAGAGPALVAAELLARTIGELPVVGELEGQEAANRGYGTGHGPAGKRIGLRPRHAGWL
jgi:hypothetical protein